MVWTLGREHLLRGGSAFSELAPQSTSALLSEALGSHGPPAPSPRPAPISAQHPWSSEQWRAEDLRLPHLHSPVVLSLLLAWYAWMGLERAGGLRGFLAVSPSRPSIDPCFLLPQHLLLFPN